MQGHSYDLSTTERPPYTRSLSSSKFSVLPAIGSCRPLASQVLLAEGAPQPATGQGTREDTPAIRDDTRDDPPADSATTHARDITLPDEPPSDAPRLLLGLKLPCGKRVQRYFRLDDTLGSLLRFAECAAGCDFAGADLVCGTVPQRRFHDLQLTIESCQLMDKTLLHIQTPDSQ